MTGAGRVRVELAAQARWYTLGVSAAALRRLIVILLCLAGAAGPARAQSGDVNVVLDQFGVGSAFRSGSFVGIRLKLTPAMESELPEATAVWVQWELPNVDGDIAEYGRPAMLTRGRSTREWLYAPLPPEPATTLAGTVWPVRVFTWEDGRTGRELGGARISPSAANATGFSARTTMIGVVGSPQMELSQYATTGPGREVYGGHEAVRIVFGIQPPDLPDRWEGLRCFQAIAWSDALPQDLPAAQAEALREWIRRGGHLIISLPEDTNPWGLGEIGRTDFDDLLPCRGRAPRRDEDVPVAALRPIFSKAQAVRTAAGASLSLRVFRDLRGGFDVIDNHYEPLIALPDGRVVVIQRNFGHGRISVIGIDLSSGSLGRALFSNGTIGDLPQADVFWNRILGWRRDTPTTGELTRINEAKRLVSPPTQRALASGKLFLERINMSAAAGAGLLLALVLFSAYWLVAGPLGFYVLKQQRQVKHAWLAFAAAAALFTALAWGGVGLLRRSEIKVRHVTFLDHIARVGTGRGEEDPQLQRARSWFSVYIPGYADVAVGIESAPALGTAPPQRDLLASWTPPGETLQRFPDVDRYTIDVSRDTDDYALPARSTATQMHADWMGGLDPDWGGLLRSDPDDPVRVEIDPTGREELRGSIINGLPGDLVNVTMIWVWNRRFATRRYAWSEGAEQAWVEPARSGQMLNAGRMWREPILEVGSTYLLPEASDRSALSTNINQRYVRPFEDRGGWAGGGAPAGIPSEAAMEMLSIFRQLDPPVYLKQPEGQRPPTFRTARELGRNLDLSAWFNRPSLIVIGYLRESACPIPLRVAGRTVNSEGLTVVRWVHPLPLIEPIAFPEPEEEEGSAQAQSDEPPAGATP